jgi:hypothetical protein
MGAQQSSTGTRTLPFEQSEKISVKNPDGTVKTPKRRSVIEFFTRNISRPSQSSLASDVCSSHKDDQKVQKKYSGGEICKSLAGGFDAFGEEDAVSTGKTAAEIEESGEQYIFLFYSFHFECFYLCYYCHEVKKNECLRFLGQITLIIFTLAIWRQKNPSRYIIMEGA